MNWLYPKQSVFVFIKEGTFFIFGQTSISFSVSRPQIVLALPIFFFLYWHVDYQPPSIALSGPTLPPFYPEIWSYPRWTLHGDDDPGNQGKHRWPKASPPLKQAQHISTEELWPRYESNCNFIVKKKSWSYGYK